ncbi:Intraflagellar transport protein 74 like protein [Argiope bruennichi]|uniref:Intraflagellar transport protein 74 like protein n=1 Tax=Argiope bruennichi TaxID=94029 RepID=A0A8T0FC08_ARGBR|nr:Intraflagellar transport protein 74 like protein [Argiope bruennichi]
METTSFSSQTSHDNSFLTTSSEKSFRIRNNPTSISKKQSVTEKESRPSNDLIHTPVFNKNVEDRPLIDQGLDITRHKARLENRQVKDKSYYMGLLYRKGYEIGAEIKKLMKKIQFMKADQSTYISCKQKAENQASELKHLQAILSDYNLIDDMYNTDTDIDELIQELQTIKTENELENAEVEKLFELNKKKEDLIRELETDISQEKYVADILSETSSPNLKNRYKNLRKMDEELKVNQIKLEEELKMLKTKKKNLEDECISLGRSETYSLIQKLNEGQIKRDSLTKEHFVNDRSIMLKKKREYNDLIKCLGNQTRNVKLQVQKIQSELDSINKKSESVQAERVQKMSKLQNREMTIDNFLATYPEKQAMLVNQLTEFQNKIKMLLEKMSSQLNFDGLGGNRNDLKNGSMEEDKEQIAEEQKAKVLLKKEILELMAKDELEDRLEEEIMKLKEEILTKKNEIDNFSNTKDLEKQFEAKKKELLLQAENVRLQRDAYDTVIKDLQKKCETLESWLQKNDVNKELIKLEKEWHYLEQNNFEMKEFLDEAKASGDYFTVKDTVMDMTRQLNETLLEI